ncbi:DUF3955 domain-containing protein [Aliiroseovarius sp. S1339]|uniref:DUF3955 domain-containing protein n=1 Tax=Aliiroseovarius sp. S1339 TaxID=2936990 RepID=UPI0020C0BC67|nr:DUF3955 domain-containing protein [Aliiroseovarius sp. S1339]MCK8465481.1 DUF3955 domain-containing protein [Aliiroseovarius sp. S1339]
MKQMLRTLGLVALVFAAASWLAERTFYSGVEITGVLQESFFLPLSFILGAVGLICLAMSFLMKAKR